MITSCECKELTMCVKCVSDEKISRIQSKAKSISFWKSVEEASKTVESWPEWKKNSLVAGEFTSSDYHPHHSNI